MTGMSAVGLAAGIGTGDDRGKLSAGMARTWERRAGAGRVYYLHEGGLYRGGLSDGWNWISVPTGKGFHIGSLLFGRRYWGGTAKGVASISPLRG